MPCKFMRLAMFQIAHKSTDVLKLCSLLIALLLINITIASNQDNIVSPLFQKKTHLSQTLDSLNLIKQNKKREGISFSDIEIKEKEILDSLQLVRQKIQTNLSSSNQNSKIDENRFPLFKWLNFSDWLMLLSAISALFFGILLLLGIVKKILYPNTEKIKKQKPAQKMENFTKLSAYENQIKPPEIISQQTQTLEEEKNTEEKSPVDHPNESKNELEAKILKAASEGKNIQEISRLFHLSSDHVSLILRLSESHPEN